MLNNSINRTGFTFFLAKTTQTEKWSVCKRK